MHEAVRCIREVFPHAHITAAKHNIAEVVISVGTKDASMLVIAVDQRDLYEKYGHPARPGIIKALHQLRR